MAVTLRGASAASTGSASTATLILTKPSGTLQNDLIMIFCAVPNYTGATGYTWSSPGFTAVSGTGASGEGNQQLLYKIAGNSEPSTYTVTMSAAYVWAAVIAGYFNTNTGLILDPLPSTSGQVSSASNTITASSITTTQNGDKLAWFGWIAGSSPPSISMPPGFTAEVTQASTSSASLLNIGVMMGDASQVTAGATGAETATFPVIAEDSSTPVPLHQGNGTTGTATTASFSPPAGSLVVVAVGILYDSQSSPTTLSCSDSLSNSYTLGPIAGGSSNACSAIFTNYYSSAPGSITVTVTNTNHNKAAMYVAPRVVTGAAVSQTGAQSLQSTSANASITTTVIGSWVYVMETEPVTASLTPEPLGSTLDHWLDTQSGDGAYLQKQTNPTTSPGSTLLGYTISGGGNGLVMLEILPAAPGAINGAMLVGIPVFTGPAVDLSPYITGANTAFF